MLLCSLIHSISSKVAAGAVKDVKLLSLLLLLIFQIFAYRQKDLNFALNSFLTTAL